MSWVALLVLLAGPCDDCHHDVHEAFATTRHARAFDEPLFQRSWQRAGRRPWCLTCHDPLGGERGIPCELCHEADARQVDGHERRPDPSLRSPDLCAHCHQFSAPEPHLEHVAMQDTLGEWRRARDAGEGRACVECHFEGVQHGTRGGHEPGTAVQVRWAGDCAVLVAPDVGHAVPTGDPFHVLRLRVCADEACRRVLATRLLARTFAWADGGVVERDDTRVPAGGERRECFPHVPRAKVLFWALEAHHAEVEVRAAAPQAEVRRVLSRGRVTITDRAP